jgi:6-phosphogluconolactonase (cycloisomerase 2 family)
MTRRGFVHISLMARLVVFAITAVAAGSATDAPAQEQPVELDERIVRLITELDDDEFAVRQAAERALAEIGEAAIARLTAATKDSALERSLRAAKILKGIRNAGVGLRHVASATHVDLNGAVNVALSPDGSFVYSPGWRSNAINIFRRNAATGALVHQATLVDGEHLAGVVHVRLSPDGKLAVATSFNSKTVCLFSRDAGDASLRLEATRRPEPGLDLQWPTDSVFSPDGQFLYTVDDRASAVFVFKIEGGKRLDLVEKNEGTEGCFGGTRSLAMHPSGNTLYVTGARSGTLCAASRDPATGKVTVRQVISDGAGGVKGLAGAMCIVCSPDGKFVYTTSGRFSGDQAVAAWAVAPDGTLSVLQEFVNDEGELKGFTGGNSLALSTDGLSLYASGTTSCGLACFRRDPSSGKLEYQATIQSDATGADGRERTLGANGLVTSSDGRFLYLALEDASAISIFERTAPRNR